MTATTSADLGRQILVTDARYTFEQEAAAIAQRLAESDFEVIEEKTLAYLQKENAMKSNPFRRASILFALIQAAAGDLGKLAALPDYKSRGKGKGLHSGKKWGPPPSYRDMVKTESGRWVQKENGADVNDVYGGGPDKGGVQLITAPATAPATDAARQWEGWGTALKPALEPITLARKPLAEKTVAANVLAHGTGAMNIEASRVPLQGGSDAAAFENNHRVAERLPADREGQALGLHDGGWKQRVGDAVIPPGRWPANLIHDGSAAVEEAFPQAQGQQGQPQGS